MKTIFSSIFYDITSNPMLSNAVSGIDFTNKYLEEAKEITTKENQLIIIENYAELVLNG